MKHRTTVCSVTSGILFFALTALNAQAAGYQLLEYVTIPITSAKPKDAVVLPNVQWKDVASIYCRYSTTNTTASSAHMLFSAATSLTAGSNTTPWLALQGTKASGSSMSLQANGATATIVKTTGDAYNRDGTVHEFTIEIANNSASHSSTAYFQFGGAWQDVSWNGTTEFYELILYGSDSSEIAHLYPCIESGTQTVGFHDTVAGEFRTKLLSSWADFIPGPVSGAIAMVDVSGNPDMFGTAVPSYGAFSVLESEQESPIVFSLAGDEPYCSADGASRGCFKSATCQFADGEPFEVNALSFSEKVTNNLSVTWNFTNVEHRAVAQASGDGTVSFGGAGATAVTNWVAAGASFTATATPDAGRLFVKWLGDTDGATGPVTSPTITLSADRPRILTAVFKVPGPWTETVVYEKTGGMTTSWALIAEDVDSIRRVAGVGMCYINGSISAKGYYTARNLKYNLANDTMTFQVIVQDDYVKAVKTELKVEDGNLYGRKVGAYYRSTPRLNFDPNADVDVGSWSSGGYYLESIEVTILKNDYIFTVAGSPAQYGSPTPGYGMSGDDAGANVSFVCSEAGAFLCDEAGTTRAKCVSATCQFDGGAPFTVPGSSFSLTLTNNLSVAWNFGGFEYGVQALAGSGGAVSVSGQSGGSATGWGVTGDELTFTATPSNGFRFVRWYGDTDGATGPLTDPTLTLPAGSPRRIFAAFEHPVPDDCVVLDYLQSNGNQWINLGIKPEIGQVVDVTLAYTSRNNNMGFFGCAGATGVRLGGQAGRHRLGCNNGNSECITFDNEKIYLHHIIVETSTYPTGAYFIDDMDYPVYQNQATASDLPYFLFASTAAANYPNPNEKGAMRFYTLTITGGEFGNVQMNLVPVRQGTTLGVFDTVTGTLFVNQGTGSFTAGPEKGHPLVVAGAPVECGAVSPAYGTTETALFGASTVCTAPASAAYGTGTATCTGYVVSTQAVDGAWAEMSRGAAASVTLVQGEEPQRLAWQWQVDDDARVAQPSVEHVCATGMTVSAFVEAVGRNGATAELSFLYGLSPAALVGEVAAGTCANAGAVTATISGLTANRTYYIKAVLKSSGVVVAESPVAVQRAGATHYAVPLTVNGYSGAALSNFPVPVRISETAIPGFTYEAAVDASHLAVAADDTLETLYTFEVECWNPGGESVVWVRVPTLEKGTTFYLHWGSGVSAPANEPTGVWAGYAGVWHMNEPTGTCANATSAGSVLDAAVAGTSPYNRARAGVLGNARQLGTYANCGALRVPASSALSVGNQLTVSCWATFDAVDGVTYIMSRKNGTNDSNGWVVQTSSKRWNALDVKGSSSTVAYRVTSSMEHAWVYLTIVYNGATATIYSNGAVIGTAGTVANVVDLDTRGLGFGVLANGTTGTLRGALDECRLLGRAETADWVAADYAAQAQADFLKVGDVKTPGLDFVLVDAEPERIGEPSDGWGCNFVDNGLVHLEMNSLAVSNATDRSRRVCTGWVFQPKDGGAALAGLGTVAEFPYAGEGTLIWQFTNLQHQVVVKTLGRASVAADVGASARALDLWVNDGDPLSLAASVDPGYVFLGWSGDLGDEPGANAAISFAGIDVAKTLTAISAVSASHYVQDGLALHLDGLENAVGRHDQSATVWKDISGNGFDFTLNANQGHWTDLGYVMTGNQVGVSALDRSKLNGKIVTCEFVWATDSAISARFFHPGYLPSNNGMVLYTTAAGQVGVYYMHYTESGRCVLPVETGTTNRFSITYSYGSDKKTPNAVVECRVNGRAVSPLAGSINLAGESSSTTLGGRATNEKGSNGRLLALRFYDRVLTEEELAHNASVDNERFFGVRDGGFSPFRLFVSSEPAEFGLPSPAVGSYEVSYGSVLDFAATPRLFPEDGVTAYPLATNDGVRAFLDHVDLAEDGAATTLATNAFARTLLSNDTSVAWHFTNVQHRLIVRAQGAGLVSVNGGAWTACATNWFAKGASVTLATSGANFAGWDGIGFESSETTVAVTMDVPRVAVAKYPVAFTPTIDDYVTDGIQLWLDGICNDGKANPHASDIKYWRDLSPNGYVVTNLQSQTETWDWTEKAFMKTTSSSNFRPRIDEFRFDWSNVTLEHYADGKPASGNYAWILYTKLDPTNNSSEVKCFYSNRNLYATWFGRELNIMSTKLVAGYVARWRNGHNARLWQPPSYNQTGTDTYTGTTVGPDGYSKVSIGHDGNGGNVLVNVPINAIRLYNRKLSDHEVRWNCAVDTYRFAGVAPDMTVAKTSVVGSPANWGTPNVPYGMNDLMFGGATHFSLVATLATDPFDGARTVVDARFGDGERGVYRGWRLDRGNQAPLTGVSESLDPVLDSPVATLEWRFERQYRILATVNEGGTVQIGDSPVGTSATNWVAAGSSVTVRAVPSPGSTFLAWSGTTAGLADVSTAEISVPVDRARTLSAVFMSADHTPTTLTWNGATSGSWYDPGCWDTGSVPQQGDTVVITPSVATEVTIDIPTPRLGRVVVGNGGSGKTTTLKMVNWQTRLQADAIEVNAGGVVTTVGGFTEQTMSNRVWLAGNTLTVAPGGSIDVRNCGYTVGPCWSKAGKSAHYQQGAVYGGGYFGAWGYNGGPDPYGDAEWPTDPGSKSGGGAVRLDFTGTVRIDGLVTADGEYKAYTVGSSGGGILIVCDRITGSGEVLARSLDKTGVTANGNGGGGGRIAVHFTPASQAAVTDCTIRFDASSSICSDPKPQVGHGKWAGMATSSEDNITLMPPGTLWMTDATLLRASSYRTVGWKFGGEWVSPEPVGDLVFDEPIHFDRCCLALPSSCSSFTALAGMTLTGTGLYARRDTGIFLSNTVVAVTGDINASGSRLELYGGSLTVNGNVNLTDNGYVRSGFPCRFNGGEVAVKAAATNGTDRAYGATVRVTGSVNVSTNSTFYLGCHPTDGAIVYMSAHRATVDLGGKISSENGGWGGALGPGSVPLYTYGHGGSHGGRGAPTNNVSHITYGSYKTPVDPGSGGSMRGGGVVRLEIDRVLTLNGSLNADASPYIGGQYSSGGAGGSVYLRVPHLVGSGSITAAGGLANQSSYGYAAGGGGRVAVWTRDTANWTGIVSAEGGYQKPATDADPLSVKTAEDGTVHWHYLPGPLCVIVK